MQYSNWIVSQFNSYENNLTFMIPSLVAPSNALGSSIRLKTLGHIWAIWGQDEW